MKKSLLALAVLGAYVGVASAQSSVTLYGTVDVNGRFVKNDGSRKRLSLSTDGLNSSQLGFRGVEDLGGGLKAGFTLLAGVNPDAGTANVGGAAGGSKFWNRRSTVSLFSNAGELRLGRDYTPTFWNMTLFDAFGFNGLGNSGNVRQLYNGTRQDNSISYWTPPNLGGFYGVAMVGAAEGGGTGDRNARYVGGRIGFAAGPFDVAVAASQERFVTTQAIGVVAGGAGGTTFNATPGSKQNTWNVGGSWDFGFAKLLGYYDHEKLLSARESMGSVTAVIPLGQSEVHLGYDRSKRRIGSTATTVDMIAATYQYNLSKRTALYGTVSRLDNKNASNITLGTPAFTNPGAGIGSATALPTSGGNSKGFELGVRHFF
jgi:predicted porin